MENENSDQQERPRYSRSAKEKAMNYRFAFFVLLAVLLASVLFSGFQSVYIYRLNNGLEGIFSYTRIAKQSLGNGTTSSSEAGETKTPAGELPEPWFSIEDAALIASSDKSRNTVVEIVKEVSPATVPISIIGIDNGQEKKITSGTGFIITEDGYIVTNAHVVENVMADPDVYFAAVILPDEDKPVRVTVTGSDVQTDIAVLKAETERKLPCVTLGDSDTLQAGELAIVIGNAMGTLDDSVTVGVISAPSRKLNREGYYVDVIQTDAAINPGNSGGPVINSFGEVVGITNAKILTSTSENLGFAIPINLAKEVVEDLINYGKVINRPYLGLSVKAVAAGSYYGASGGVFIASMVKDGPAYNAGLMPGDRILTMDGVEINEAGDIIIVRDKHAVGDEIVFVVERDGNELSLTLTIGDSADY